MKQGIHPDYHKITVQMTDGTKYDTFSTWGKEGDVLQLDVDPKTHPAWVGGINLRKTGQMEKFQNKFGDFKMASKAKNAAAPAPKKKEAKAEAKADVADVAPATSEAPKEAAGQPEEKKSEE